MDIFRVILQLALSLEKVTGQESFTNVFYRWAQRTVTFDLLRDLLPGPVTTVFERSSQLNAQLNPGTALVGIRVPDHPIARQLAACCGHPLALTSANVSDAGNTVAVEVSRGEERLRQPVL